MYENKAEEEANKDKNKKKRKDKPEPPKEELQLPAPSAAEDKNTVKEKVVSTEDTEQNDTLKPPAAVPTNNKVPAKLKNAPVGKKTKKK